MKQIYNLRKVALAAVCTCFGASAFAQAVAPTKVFPEPGFINEPISKVVLDFSVECSSIEFSDRALNYYDPDESKGVGINDGVIFFGGDEVDQAEDMYSASIEGTQITFTPKETWNSYGKYRIMIPAGALIFTREDGTTFSNSNMINYKWKYGILPNISAEPAPGIVKDLSTFSLVLPEGYVFAGGYPAVAIFNPKVYSSDAAGTKLSMVGTYTTLENKETWENSNKVVYSNPSFTPENGQYYLVEVQESYLNIQDEERTVDAERNLAMSFLYQYFKVNEVDGIAFTLTPEDGETISLDKFQQVVISVSASDCDGLSPNLDLIEEEGVNATLVNGDKVVVLNLPEDQLNYYKLELTPAEKLTPGTWTLNIPEKYFFIDIWDDDSFYPERKYNEKITATYIITQDSSEVSVIEAESELNVYSIDGVKYNVESLDLLPAGLWIVNGKKVVVK